MSNPNSGRDAAIARRRALSAGKAALPPPAERTRSGFRDASLAGPPAATPAPAHAPSATAAPAAPSRLTSHAISGREASLERRRMLSAGKAALQAGIPLKPAPTAPEPAYTAPAPALRVTGSRVSRGGQVTGDQRGTQLPVSGTSHIDTKAADAPRVCGTKVGQVRTEAGLVVTGTLVRSAVRITGDERGDHATITGEADSRPSDDLTARQPRGAAIPAQFQRQANPHGSATFASNISRSAQDVGSRQRTRTPAIEATEAGTVITGSAIGRSLRVTGDESGACRPISGSQYLAPARLETACGGVGGGTAPAAQLGTARPDPVTLTKVAVSASWGGQRITGIDVENHASVTGDAPANCAAPTGSQYLALPASAAKSATARRMLARAHLPVTGNTPTSTGAGTDNVSGLHRGAERNITGTPYFREDPAAESIGNPVAAVDARFSIHTPQRSAHLRNAARGAEGASNDTGRITGSFAVGGGKVTGNFEFTARPRATAANEAKPAHSRLSGEGSSTGTAITGDSWANQSRVTGTEGAFASARNPSVRPTGAGEKPKAFAGAIAFKNQAHHHEEPKQLVTGMFGYFSKTGARVTLSGGAQS
jgi:hypothetical protein